MIYSKIAGTGSYLPERVMHNKEFEKLVDTSDEWIRERTGIGARRIAADDQPTSELCAAAVRAACSDAGVEVDSIDALVVATTIRLGGGLVITHDPDDLTKLAADHSNVTVAAI